METLKIILLIIFIATAFGIAQSKYITNADSANIGVIDKEIKIYEQAMEKIKKQNENLEKNISKNNEDYYRLDGVRLFLLEQKKAVESRIDSTKGSNGISE